MTEKEESIFVCLIYNQAPIHTYIHTQTQVSNVSSLHLYYSEYFWQFILYINCYIYHNILLVESIYIYIYIYIALCCYVLLYCCNATYLC